MADEHETRALESGDVFAMMLRSIDSMAENEAEEHALPYTSEKRRMPLNAVTGTETTDMNGVAIELYAAMLGAASATYMEGCNAQLIGLELDGYEGPVAEDFSEYSRSGIMDGSTYGFIKERKTLPVLMMRNVRGADGSERPEYSYAYLVDQFTGESMARAARTLGETAGAKEKPGLQKSHVARHLFGSMAEHDRGISLAESEAELSNIRRNMRPDSGEHRDAAALRKFYTQDRTKEEAALFDCLRKRKINMRHIDGVIEEKFDGDVIESLVKRVASKKNGRFALIAFWGNDFSERMSRRGFRRSRAGYEPVEPPKAMSRDAAEIVRILDRQREELRRSREARRQGRKPARTGRDK